MKYQRFHSIIPIKAALYTGACCLLFFAFNFSSCKKADQFYKELTTLPQINNTSAFAYRTAYVVGDTMSIVGKLQPKNNLQISIGGIAAPVIATGPGGDGGSGEDKVSILITGAMVGKAREVKVTSGGYTILGAAIDVYTAGGEGSFNSALGSVQTATLSGAYKFLYGVTGKGDVFYYAPNTKDLRRIQKDGTTTIIYDLSTLNISSFLAGGVDPQEQYLYFSVQLSAGYALYKLNIQNNTLTQLNQSAGLNAPYEGNIAAAQMIVTGIYPDSKGDLYLGMGVGNNSAGPGFVPDAIARYNAADGSIRYIYKGLIYPQTYVGMPGVKIPTGNIIGVRFSPGEDLLYTIAIAVGQNQEIGIQLYNLKAGVLLQDLETSNSTGTAAQYDVIAPFTSLKINLGSGSTDDSFGFLPMSNKRLQVLLFQHIDGSIINQGGTDVAGQFGFPKWVVFDFANLRTYAYATGKFDLNNGNYSFRSNDELLNYDEAGNLYTTSNGKSYLLKTQPN